MAEQIAALRAAEGISADDAATALTEGQPDFLRSVDHILRLVTGKAPNGGLPENEAPRQRRPKAWLGAGT
jgi:hypothetical protein